MNITIHQTHHLLADFEAIYQYLKKIIDECQDNQDSHLHLFPELALTGYLLRDLIFDKNFQETYFLFLEKIQFLLDHCDQQNMAILIGHYQTIFSVTIDMIFSARGAPPSTEKTSANEISIGSPFYFVRKNHSRLHEVTAA